MRFSFLGVVHNLCSLGHTEGNRIFKKRIRTPNRTGSKRWQVPLINCFCEITKEVDPQEL